jgi:hypothetical protein
MMGGAERTESFGKNINLWTNFRVVDMFQAKVQRLNFLPERYRAWICFKVSSYLLKLT